MTLWPYLDPPAPPGGVVEGESSGARKKDEIVALLVQAEANLAALRFTSPAGDNALEQYRKVLTLAPDNAAAKAGLQGLADRFVGLARQATDAGDFDQAADHLRQAEGIVPVAPDIALAKNERALRKAAAEREAAAAEARREQVETALRAADAALAKDDAPSMLARLEEARKAGAEPAVLDERRGRLRDRIETLAAAVQSDVEQARKKKDPEGIRAAVKRLRDLNAQAAALGSTRP